jgi:hypothetical protein
MQIAGWSPRATPPTVKQHDDYIAGPHSYWLQFGFGLCFGAGAGYWIGAGFFSSLVWLGLAVVLSALGCAWFCGRWGQAAWQVIAHWLAHWWRLFIP